MVEIKKSGEKLYRIIGKELTMMTDEDLNKFKEIIRSVFVKMQTFSDYVHLSENRDDEEIYIDVRLQEPLIFIEEFNGQETNAHETQYIDLINEALIKNLFEPIAIYGHSDGLAVTENNQSPADIDPDISKPLYWDQTQTDIENEEDVVAEEEVMSSYDDQQEKVMIDHDDQQEKASSFIKEVDTNTAVNVPHEQDDEAEIDRVAETLNTRQVVNGYQQTQDHPNDRQSYPFSVVSNSNNTLSNAVAKTFTGEDETFTKEDENQFSFSNPNNLTDALTDTMPSVENAVENTVENTVISQEDEFNHALADAHDDRYQNIIYEIDLYHEDHQNELIQQENKGNDMLTEPLEQNEEDLISGSLTATEELTEVSSEETAFPVISDEFYLPSDEVIKSDVVTMTDEPIHETSNKDHEMHDQFAFAVGVASTDTLPENAEDTDETITDSAITSLETLDQDHQEEIINEEESQSVIQGDLLEAVTEIASEPSIKLDSALMQNTDELNIMLSDKDPVEKLIDFIKDRSKLITLFNQLNADYEEIKEIKCMIDDKAAKILDVQQQLDKRMAHIGDQLIKINEIELHLDQLKSMITSL